MSALAETFGQRLSLKHPAVRATVFTFGSYFVSQTLRFCSNLILTRLLMPEAFGVMVIVNLWVQGLEMFSDLGLGPSIVQSARGEQITFLRTAWTVNIIKNGILWSIAATLAYPMSRLYGEPILMYVFPVVALNLLINSMVSANVGILRRRLWLGRLVAIEMSCYVVNVTVMITLAYFWRNVWALVVGSLVGNSLSTMLTHLVVRGEPMRFTLERDTIHEIFHFGKWLFFSSILTFLCGQLDRIVMPKFMTVSELGVYGLALMLSQVFVVVTENIAHKVLFPLYARAAEIGIPHLRRQAFRFRGGLMLVTLPPLWLLAVFGPEITAFLYPENYHDAGLYLRILAAGGMFVVILVPAEYVLMASGDTLRHLLLQFTKSIVFGSCMITGGYFWGAWGVMGGFTLSRIAYYPIQVVLIRRYGTWMPLLDFGGVAASIAIVLLGFWLNPW